MKNLNTKLSNERKILEEAEKIIKQANQTLLQRIQKRQLVKQIIKLNNSQIKKSLKTAHH